MVHQRVQLRRIDHASDVTRDGERKKAIIEIHLFRKNVSIDEAHYCLSMSVQRAFDNLLWFAMSDAACAHQQNQASNADWCVCICPDYLDIRFPLPESARSPEQPRRFAGPSLSASANSAIGARASESEWRAFMAFLRPGRRLVMDRSYCESCGDAAFCGDHHAYTILEIAARRLKEFPALRERRIDSRFCDYGMRSRLDTLPLKRVCLPG